MEESNGVAIQNMIASDWYQSLRQLWRVVYHGHGLYWLLPLNGWNYENDSFKWALTADIYGNIYRDDRRDPNNSIDQLFSITQISTGIYSIKPAITGSAVALQVANSNAGTWVTTSAVNTSSTYQQWIFQKLAPSTPSERVHAYGGVFYKPIHGFNYEDVKQTVKAFKTMGYNNAFYFLNPARAMFIANMELGIYQVFECHGSTEFFQFDNLCIWKDRPTPPASPNPVDIYIDDLDLAGVKLIISKGCSTAASVPGGQNICQKLVALGVGTVIGWPQITSTDDYGWMDDFYNYMLQGKTVSQTVALLNDKYKTDPCLKEAKVEGNQNLKLVP